MRVIHVAGILAIGLTAVGCGLASPAGRDDASAAEARPTVAPVTGQTNPSAVQPAPDTSIAVVPVGLDFTHFASPSGNIECVITSSGNGELVARGVRCDIAERDWSPPPRPADCELDYGHAILVGAGKPARFLCAGDTTIGSGGGPLAYGDAITAGRLRCESAQSGITCRDVESGHGFSISREAYQLF
jgi:hypothetical protein